MKDEVAAKLRVDGAVDHPDLLVEDHRVELGHHLPFPEAADLGARYFNEFENYPGGLRAWGNLVGNLSRDRLSCACWTGSAKWGRSDPCPWTTGCYVAKRDALVLLALSRPASQMVPENDTSWPIFAT